MAAGAEREELKSTVPAGVLRQELPGGACLLVEPDSTLRSVSIGVWVRVGARDEPSEQAGASHFLEHLLFKGTARRSAREISEAIDGVGGDINAYTAKESTTFYVRVPADHAEMAIDVLFDVVGSPRLHPDDVEAERHVIREELLQRDDTPDDLVHDLATASLFPGHPLGRDILGDRATIEALGADEVADFFHRHYGSSTFVVAVSGAIDSDRVATEIAQRLDGRRGEVVSRTPPATGVAPVRVDRRSTEQVHLVLGWRGLHHAHRDRYALAIANHVLGGGLASRLFEEVRERRGLAYSVYSYLAGWSDAGLLAVYAGTAPERAAETARLIRGEVEQLVADGITEHELAVATGYAEGALALSLEQTSSRMSRLAHSELAHGRIVTVEEQLAAYQAVTLADVRRVLDDVVTAPPVVAAVGAVGEEEVRAWLQ